MKELDEALLIERTQNANLQELLQAKDKELCKLTDELNTLKQENADLMQSKLDLLDQLELQYVVARNSIITRTKLTIFNLFARQTKRKSHDHLGMSPQKKLVNLKMIALRWICFHYHRYRQSAAQ